MCHQLHPESQECCLKFAPAHRQTNCAPRWGAYAAVSDDGPGGFARPRQPRRHVGPSHRLRQPVTRGGEREALVQGRVRDTLLLLLVEEEEEEEDSHSAVGLSFLDRVNVGNNNQVEGASS
ncbi:unnamed protein product [Merluccius merluccius]